MSLHLLILFISVRTIKEETAFSVHSFLGSKIKNEQMKKYTDPLEASHSNGLATLKLKIRWHLTNFSFVSVSLFL